MEKMLQEIMEIPQRASKFWQTSKKVELPLHVPYLGMGSSYFAPLAFKYMGLDIQPEIASEFFYYQAKNKKLLNGVILSQSGLSSEALWCMPLFEKYTAISNYPKNTLCTGPNISDFIDIIAGDEQYSSSKTYINTLLALFKGFGIDATKAINLLIEKMPEYEKIGSRIADQLYDLVAKNETHGIYITGSGPNIATAMEAALILSESVKRNFHGLAMAQYDHGPKETAAGSIVIQIVSRGPSYERSMKLSDTISKKGATVITVEEKEADENFSILHNIIPFNFACFYLAQMLDIKETFLVGGKVTRVSE